MGEVPALGSARSAIIGCVFAFRAELRNTVPPRIHSIALVFLLVACGGPGRAPRQPTGAGAAAARVRAYPVLARLPAPVTYAVVTARVDDLSRALRELALAVGLVADAEVGDLDGELVRDFGVSPLRVNDLAQIGISVDRSAAVFSRELYPTLLLPVADVDQLDSFIQRRLPEHGVSVRRHRGHEVYTWRREVANEDPFAGHDSSWVHMVSWALVEDWLVLHIGGSRTARDLTWLDDVLPSSGTPRLAGHEDLAAAIATARRHLPERRRPASPAHPLLPDEAGTAPARPGIIGVARQRRLLAALRAAAPAELSPCWLGFADDPGLLVLAADATWDGADGLVAVELTAPAARELADAVGSAPPPGFAAFRKDSGLYLGVRIGPAWLSDLAARSHCRLAAPGEGFASRLGGRALQGIALAGSDFRVDFTHPRNGRAVAYLGLSDRSFAERLLDQIPLRKSVARRRKVHGVDVDVISIPLVPEVAWTLDDHSLCVAIGDGVMQRVLAPAGGKATGAPGAEIAAAGIAPARIADLPESLARLGAAALGLSSDRLRSFAARAARRLGRYDYGRLRLAIDGKSLVLTGQMRLR